MSEGCPKCGGKDGYYERLLLRGEQQYDWEGNPTGFIDKGRSQGGVRKYCTECDRDVTEDIVVRLYNLKNKQDD